MAPVASLLLSAGVWHWSAFPSLLAMLSVYVVLVTSSAMASRFRDVLNIEIVQGFTHFLRNDLYDNLIQVDWLYFTRTRAADITHVLTAGMEMVDYGTQQLFLLVSTLVIVTVNIGVAFTLSPAMTVLSLGVGALLLLILQPFKRQALHKGKELYQARVTCPPKTGPHVKLEKWIFGLAPFFVDPSEAARKLRSNKKLAVALYRKTTATLFNRLPTRPL
jgi:ABC-type multidrug transport system fused ATPase/permease subunit